MSVATDAQVPVTVAVPRGAPVADDTTVTSTLQAAFLLETALVLVMDTMVMY